LSLEGWHPKVPNIFSGSQKNLIDQRVAELINPLLPLIRSDKEGLPFIQDDAKRQSYEICAHKLGICFRAFLELHTVLDNMHLTLGMSNRYPWGGKTLSKSQHLYFVWFQFVNLCYVFETKYKLSANQYNDLMKFFQIGAEENVKNGLKIIRKKIGHYIRDRGNYTHEWYVNHQAVHLFHLVEFLHNHGKEVSGLHVSDHYVDAKYFLYNDIKVAIVFMEGFLLEALDGYIGHLGEITGIFSENIEQMRVDAGLYPKDQSSDSSS